MVSENTQAILLLTTHFPGSRDDAIKPLTPKEWGNFAAWLKEHDLTPELLLKDCPTDLLKEWPDKEVALDRIDALLHRGAALALAMEKWIGAGLWIVTRSDDEYPSRLKRRLGLNSPAVLFGCGGKFLLNGSGAAVVGSRNASNHDLEYARAVGSHIAARNWNVVSGGARGIDQEAMLGALEEGGTAVGVLADSLLRASSSSKYRRYLIDNNLVLVSTFNPEASFNTGNAMQRNKYIYCLSDWALVVHSGTKGGTWSGATENLKKGWIPLLVKPTNDKEAGNSDLVNKGALWALPRAGEVSIELPSEVSEPQTPWTVQPSRASAADASSMDTTVDSTTKWPGQPITAPDETNLYDFFIETLRVKFANKGMTRDELSELFVLGKGQINTWLKKAIEEKCITKSKKRPILYKWDSQSSFPIGDREMESTSARDAS